jgi:hypothetical protein
VASDFPQESFLEAVVLTLNEMGWFESGAADRWRVAVRDVRQKTRVVANVVAQTTSDGTLGTTASPALHPARAPLTLPGHIGWRADRTYKMTNLETLAAREIPDITTTRYPDGVTLWCDQSDMTAFREEYEFLYDAGNGGGENVLDNGFALVGSDSASRGRACRLRTHRSAMKMTTASLRFTPSALPQFDMRVLVTEGVAGVAPNKGGRGKNDATLKLWLVLRDERPEAKGKRMLFGYSWAGPDADGRVPTADSLVEGNASRRRIGFSVLPEAWLINIGGPSMEQQWVTVSRDLAADVARAYPGIPLDALRVVAITVQTDSDETRGDTEVLLDRLSFRPRVSASAIGKR